VIASPEVAVLHLHLALEGELVTATEGEVLRLDERAERGPTPAAGEPLSVGHVVYVGAGGRLITSARAFDGGRRGRAHGFVDQTSVAAKPSRADVPRLLAELEALRRDAHGAGAGPLDLRPTPPDARERASAADFAFQNLVLEEARTLEERVARAARAVLLFTSGEAAVIAAEGLSLRGLIDLVRATGRPVQPHAVDHETIAALLGVVYGARPGPGAS